MRAPSIVRFINTAITLMACLILANPLAVFAADTCCTCTPPGGTPGSCVTIDTQKLTSGQRVTGACARLPSVVGDSLKGWTCSPNALSESECKSTAPGLCKKEPVDAFTVGKATEAVGPAGGTSAATGIPKEPGIVPQLNVPIPGLTFTPPDGGSNPLLAQYVTATYTYLITISAVAATVMFTWGAFQYLLGSALPSIKSGKRVMQESILGMILVLSASMILRTINPELAHLRSLTVEPITPYSDFEAELPSGATIGTYVKPQAICRDQACAAYCDGCKVKYPLPSAPWIPSPSELTTITAGPGLSLAGVGRPQLRKEAAEALMRAGTIAQNAPGGPYTIKLGEAFRPLDQQMGATCKKLCGGTQKQFAAPGSSLHGTGIAVDVQLWKNGTLLVSPQDPLSNQAKSITEQSARLLQKIMSDAGWVQYCPEIWHWEYGVPEGGEKSKHCPWPPPEPRR